MQNPFRYELVKAWPFLGPLIRIANAYVWRGQLDYIRRVAPLADWWSRLLRQALVLAVLSALLVAVAHWLGVMLDPPPHRLALDVIPNLLGFGVGVFALLFVLPPTFLRYLHEARHRIGMGPEILPADMAWPLVAMAGVLLAAMVLEVLPRSVLTEWLGVFLALYALAMVFELVSTIFSAGTRVIQDVIKDEMKQERNDGSGGP